MDFHFHIETRKSIFVICSPYWNLLNICVLIYIFGFYFMYVFSRLITQYYVIKYFEAVVALWCYFKPDNCEFNSYWREWVNFICSKSKTICGENYIFILTRNVRQWQKQRVLSTRLPLLTLLTYTYAARNFEKKCNCGKLRQSTETELK